MGQIKENYINERMRSRGIREDILKYITYENNEDFLNKVTPKSLYKYLKLNKETLECLRSSKIYVLEPSKFDYTVGVKTSAETYNKALNKRLFQLKDTRKRYKIISLNEIDDSKSMWDMQGENHCGICVEYDFSRDNRYKDQTFKVNYLDNTLDISNIPNNISRDVIELIVRNNKFSCEKEWRILDYVYNKEEKIYDKMYVMPHIKSITLGKNFIIPIAEEFSKGRGERIFLLDQLVEFIYSKNIPLFYENCKIGTYDSNKIRLNIGTMNIILKNKKDSVYNLWTYINKLRMINEEEKLRYIFIDNPDDKEGGWIFATNNYKSISRICNYIKLLFDDYSCRFNSYIADSRYIKIEKFIKKNKYKYSYCINDELLLIEEIYRYLAKFK